MDKEKFYNAADKLPLIRVLQVMAALIMALSILQIAMTTLPAIFAGYSLLNGLLAIVTQLAQATFVPLVLISLAEIIKLLRSK
jgi:hypothetical protein